MKTAYRWLRLSGLVALLTPVVATAQLIEVKDLESGDIVETLEPGDSLTLEPGDEIRLIMSVEARGRTRYPQTEYWEGQPGGGCARITNANVENANVTIHAGGGNCRAEQIGFRILEDVPGELEGYVTIRVEEDDEEEWDDEEDSAPSRDNYGRDWATDITAALYQGILLREMDSSGGRDYSNRIRRGGYLAVVQIAQEIARSEESRVDIYERGVTNRQRLSALYEHLLDLDTEEVDDDAWSDDLRRINEGRLSDLVGDMVRSRRFRELHEL